MHIVSCSLRVDDQAVTAFTKSFVSSHCVLAAWSQLRKRLVHIDRNLGGCGIPRIARLRVRKQLCCARSGLPRRLGSDWITRIADGQTIAYSVSADELSMPHVSL